MQRPFTLASSTISVSSLGAQFQIVTNLNSRLNLRAEFNDLYWKKWITYGGFTAPASVNLISHGTVLDFYPFRDHAFRLSSGLLIHNSVAGSSAIQLGPARNGSFTLNGHTYYSAYTPIADPSPFKPLPGPEPPKSIEQLRLPKSALSMTLGLSDMLHRKRAGTWTFPLEAGVAFLGSPELKAAQITGQICDVQFQNCVDASSSAQFKSDLEAHFNAYKNRLGLLRTYPILSFGVAHSFGARHLKD